MTRLVIRPSRTIGGQGLSSLASGLIVATLIILFLYMGREILEPLVIAALLGFILAPLIRRLRGWGLWRVPSVILTVLFAITVIAALGSTIALQVAQLAEDLPKYETNLRAKIRTLGGGALTSSALDRASGTLKDLQNELSKSGASPTPTEGQKPLMVEVRQPDPKGLESIGNVVRPLLSPLATTALTILFLMFILLQREDIRDRFLRLAGTADLQRSTAALDDAASRLSRFFLMQTILNTAFGVFIGTGLWLIGVPNAVLWGILAGLMRFVPFVGSIIAAVFPIVLAAAVDPGWSMVLATAALFIVAEPLAGHVIEPRAVRPAYRPITSCHCRLDPLLGAAVGAYRSLARDAVDRLPRGPRTAHRAAGVYRGAAGRRTCIGTGGAVLPAASCWRCHRGR